MASTTRLVLASYLLLTLSVGEAAATLYCNRSYAQLKRDPGRPYNAVGFLNNGCTAFLIDANHIVAAAHCFVDGNGAWQPNLRFYVNFHPSRVKDDKMHVPRGDVTRAVVGSRVARSMGDGYDWGIARIGNWADTAGLDLTPLPLATSLPPVGTALVNPAYTRHHFPYDDDDATNWDNMEWDSTYCGSVGNHQGMWAVKMRTAPIFDGNNSDLQGCNSRWAAGFIHADCSLATVSDEVVVHNCDTIGGSSGSPIIYKDNDTWRVIGVGHGGGETDFSELAPVCVNDTPDRRDNTGASVNRFRDAPRFASNVAVHRRPRNASATAVFAVDSDSNKVVYRFRTGPSPTYTSNFSFWSSLGSPSIHRGAKLTRIAACSADAKGSPQIFVVEGSKNIYTRTAQPNGQWGSWSSFGIPDSAGSVSDIDAAADANGRCQLFMVAEGGSAFTRAKTSDISWGSWSSVASGSYNTITVLNNSNQLVAAMVDTAGEIWRTSLGPTGWASAIKLSRPPGVGAWRDIDMTYDEAGRGFMLAIPTSGGSKLWLTPMYGSQAWLQWHAFETHLWAPGICPQDAPNMQSLSASTWMEAPVGTTSPVVFATDDKGNVYFIEYARVAHPGWILDWKSFYHEYIPYY